MTCTNMIATLILNPNKAMRLIDACVALMAI
jgi:hypothetical protein